MPYPTLNRKEINNFSGGMSNSKHPSEIEDNQLYDINNYTINDDGSLVLGMGISKYYDAEYGSQMIEELTKLQVGDIDTFAFIQEKKVYVNDFIQKIEMYADDIGTWHKSYVQRIVDMVEFKRITPAFQVGDLTSNQYYYPKQKREYLAYNIPRYHTCKYGYGILIEEETANLLENSGFEDSYQGWDISNVNGTLTKSIKQYSDEANKPFEGSNYLYLKLFKPSGESSATMTLSQTIPVYMMTGVYNSLSMVYKIKEEGTGNIKKLRLVYRNAANDILTTDEKDITGNNYNTGTYMMQHIIKKVPDTAHTATISIEVSLSGGIDKSVELDLDAFQYENKIAPTTYINGERSKETVFINTNSLFPIKGSFMYWYKNYFTLNEATQFHQITDVIWGEESEGVTIRREYRNDKWYLQMIVYTPQPEMIEKDITGSTITQFIAVTWNDVSTALYFNGQLVGEINKPPINTSNNIELCGSGIYEQFTLASTKLTNTEASRIYGQNKPEVVGKYYEYVVRFNNVLYGEKYNMGQWISNPISVVGLSDTFNAIIRKLRVGEVPVTVDIGFVDSPNESVLWEETDMYGRFISPQKNYFRIRVWLMDNIYNKIIWTHAFDNIILAKFSIKDYPRLIGELKGEGRLCEYDGGLLIVDYPYNPKKWKVCEHGDGHMVDLLGNPPDAKYILEADGLYYLAHTSLYQNAVYVSDILNPEKWDYYNMVMVGKGDPIRSMVSIGDYKIIGKKDSIWVMTVNSVDDVKIEKIHDIGVVGDTLLECNKMLVFVSYDGVYMSDLSQAQNITKNISEFWNRVNKDRLEETKIHYNGELLRIVLPMVR